MVYEQRYEPIKIPPIEPGPSRIELHDYHAMVTEIRSLAEQYPNDMQNEIIGQSGTGREIYLVKIGSGKRKLLVNNAVQSAETTGVEASLSFIAKLVKNDISQAEELKRTSTLLVIPMLSVDGVDLYVKLRRIVPSGFTENLYTMLDLAEKYPYARKLMAAWKGLSGMNKMAVMDSFDWYATHRDRLTGLDEHTSNFEEWLWTDSIDSEGCYTIGGDCWQLRMPEAQSLRQALLKYKPQYVIDMHNTSLWDIPEGIIKGDFGNRQLDWALYTIPASNTEFFAEDPEAGIKGTLLRDRFSDPKWLRFSSLTLREKSIPGYLHPKATEWELKETLNISKVASAAVEEAHQVQSAPIGWMYWNGQSARPTGVKSSAVMNPEFECAGVVFETYGGACEVTDLELSLFRPIYETVIESILRYVAAQEGPKNWENFPVFQSPFDVWRKEEFIRRKFDSVGIDPRTIRRTHFYEDTEWWLKTEKQEPSITPRREPSAKRRSCAN